MRNEEDEEWARAGKGAHVCDEETRLDDRAHPVLASVVGGAWSKVGDE